VAVSEARVLDSGSVPAVFLDKDGTLLEDVPYNVDPGEMRLMPGAGPALRKLADAGFSLIVVSNQSGVARAYFPPTALRAVEWRLGELLEPFGVKLSGVYTCPHHPEGIVARYAVECSCRKPAPGLLLTSAADHDVSLDHSWMIGDILDDVEAGCRAGCRTLLLDGTSIGGETEWQSGECRTPTVSAADWSAAAALILGNHEERKEARCDAIYSN
jgi:D-glycero-D-manno-heptose 1,7-bisphosphate phosphatase